MRRVLTLLFLLTAAGCAGGRPLVVAAVSCESRTRDVAFNLERIEHWSRRAAAAGADVVLFPECALQGWWQSRENRRLAEPVDGPSLRRLAALARELDLCIAVGLTERDGDRVYIAHVLLDRDGVVGTHRKSDLAGGPEGEGRVWDRGNDANVFDVRGRRIGVAICYESVQPETCATLAKKGAEIVLAPYANGTRPDEITDAQRRQRRWVWERARENRVWYVACDATPRDGAGRLEPGAAYVIDPEGRLAACTPVDAPGEAMVVQTIP